ncbi:MAG: phosphate:sodium symporter [Bacteroidetes bacterium HGW-Bacteroidetes-6]|jgi:phosphate/sulfate permease|nr:MAG: phosphate:sodium symporter [Bacteroidetes bacterium HGW-Bacteroidetes-6]
MDYYYLAIIVVLFALTILNLTIGVANDAVNFLNNAWGAKAASFKVLMITASAGVFVGAMFAGGMMEVARSGVFHPQYFAFGEVIMIFLAVMLTNVLLIDFFNTLGLPTSTTVSLVAGLLGAAFAYSAIKVSANGEAFGNIATYINTDKALAMISAIFVSITIAFFVGVILQYLARIVFSFSFERYKLVGGSIFSGIAIGLISYFIFFKGLKSAPFVTEDLLKQITGNILLIEGVLMAGLTFLFIILQSLFRLNVFKVVVIYGTFALAMSFAGNDLVNFIGPPLAAYDSFSAYTQSGATDPMAFTMESLRGGAPTPTLFLLASGLIMVLTLWFSKKTRTVIRTSVDLSRQNEGQEKFDANPIARSIVKMTIMGGKVLSVIRIPSVHRWIDGRFKKPEINNNPEAPAFDMVRAAVSLTVASSLIAVGTSMKLPLSTTYVTFMVTMGTSLADRAWDRESAVFRVSGVITVIGGWFVTAFLAFFAAALIAWIFYLGGYISVVALIALSVFLLIRSSISHRRREIEHKEAEEMMHMETDAGEEEIIELSKTNVYAVLDVIPEILETTNTGLFKEKTKTLKKAEKMVRQIDKRTSVFKSTMNVSIAGLGENYLTVGDYYIKNTDILREIAVSLNFLIHPVSEHVANQHKNLTKSQFRDLSDIISKYNVFAAYCRERISGDYGSEYQDELLAKQLEFKNHVQEIRLNQIKRIKSKEAASKSNILFFNMIAEVYNLSKFLVELTENELKFNKFK